MVKSGHSSTRSSSAHTVRTEHGSDEDRPLAEVRQSLLGVLRILTLHRGAFFIPFTFVACAAFILSLYFPRTFTATTTFERRNDPVMIDLPISPGAASFNHFRTTAHRDLTSLETMTEVVEKLGLTKDFERDAEGSLNANGLRQRKSLASSLSSRLNTNISSPSEHVDLIQVTYTGPDATIGKRLVEEVKKTYIRRTMVWLQGFLRNQRDYFQRASAEALEEVREAERDETRLRLENPHVNPRDPGEISTKLSQLELERRGLALRQREYEAELAANQQLLAGLEATFSPFDGTSSTLEDRSTQALSPNALMLGVQIKAMDAEIARLRKERGMTLEHPEIAEKLSRRRQLTDSLDGEPDASLASAETAGSTVKVTAAELTIQPWQSDRARLQVQIELQEAKLREIDISLQGNSETLAELHQAKENVFSKQEEFTDVTERVSRARQRHGQLENTLAAIEPAIKAVEQNRLMQFSEDQPARGAVIPISPKSTTVVLLSILAGLGAGAICVVLAEVFDHVYRSSGQVSRNLGLPILESIDEIVTAIDRRRLLVHRLVFAPVIAAACVILVALTGAMAYLSLERPWTYQRVRGIPEAALRLFVSPTQLGTDLHQTLSPSSTLNSKVASSITSRAVEQ